MKILSLILVFLLGHLASGAVIAYPWFDADASDSLNLGLISYWTLNGISGTRADTEPTGTPQDLTDNNSVTSTVGKISSAAFFTAANTEYLSHADSADLSTGNIDFTIAGWFRATTLSGDSILASHWTTIGNQRSWRLWFHSAIGKMEFEVSDDGVTATTAIAASTFGLPATNVWYFIHAIHDASANTISIAINNGSPNTTTHTTGVYDSTSIFDLGARGAGANPWDGALDEWGFWKRALTAIEITRLYNLGNGLTCCPF